MILLTQQDHGCVYTLDTDTREVFYAPIYQDNTVNLNEFAPVDLTDENEVEIQQIQQELISLSK